MQGSLPFISRDQPKSRFDLPRIFTKLKVASSRIGTCVCVLLEWIFIPPPGQKYIDETRTRAMQHVSYL